MNEIYWITRLDTILGFFLFILIISIVLLACFGGWYLCTKGEDNIKFSNDEMELFKRINISFIVALIISTTVIVFVPTTKEACIIYGFGGIVDYIKQNDKAAQLSDEVIDALEVWVDNINQE